MSIFSLKKKTLARAGTPVKTDKVKKLEVKTPDRLAAFSSQVTGRAGQVILRPRVTEKASVLSQEGRSVYVFEVSRLANKKSVADAIRELYEVTPEKIAILKVPAKRSFVRGRIVSGKQGRKAYVYLKKGDKIEIV